MCLAKTHLGYDSNTYFTFSIYTVVSISDMPLMPLFVLTTSVYLLTKYSQYPVTKKVQIFLEEW